MTDDLTTIRIGDLKRKLKARQGRKEYRESILLIEAEIARLEAIVAGRKANAHSTMPGAE